MVSNHHQGAGSNKPAIQLMLAIIAALAVLGGAIALGTRYAGLSKSEPTLAQGQTGPGGSGQTANGLGTASSSTHAFDKGLVGKWYTPRLTLVEGGLAGKGAVMEVAKNGSYIIRYHTTHLEEGFLGTDSGRITRYNYKSVDPTPGNGNLNKIFPASSSYPYSHHGRVFVFGNTRFHRMKYEQFWKCS